MRGVILAGGTGSRLMPLTKSINKHLLPVGGKPMIYWPLKVLLDNHITRISIVSSPSGVGQLAAYLGSGHEFGCQADYHVQDQPGGIAQALACVNTYDLLTVILGDNVFLPSPKLPLSSGEPRCYLKRFRLDSPDLSDFGVPSFHSMGEHITAVFEKPEVPPSEFAITGLYSFGPGVFDMIKNLPPSKRGEIEITDVLNEYAKERRLFDQVVDGFWGDAGTFDGMAECDKACKEFA